MTSRFFIAAAAVAALLMCGAQLRATAQSVTADDIGAAMIGDGDVPGFRLAGDATPPSLATATRDQRTRLFVPTDSNAGTVLLTVFLSVPRSTAVCLPYLPATVASGDVFGALNADKPNFRITEPLGAGDIDATATWDDYDAGRSASYTVLSELFLRGSVSVYITYVTYTHTIDPALLAQIARIEDAKLMAAAAAGTPVGTIAATPIPPLPDSVPPACQGL